MRRSSGPEFKNDVTKMMAHVQQTPPPISLLRTDLPPGLAAVIERMMAKKPEDRFATPGEVAAALEPFAAGCDLGRLLNEANGMLGLPTVETPRSASTGKLSGSAHVGHGRPGPAPRYSGADGSRRRAGRGSGRRRIWIALAAAAAAIPLLFGIWVIIRDRSGKEVGTDAGPEGGSAELVDDQGRPVKDVRDSLGRPQATPKTKPSSKKTVKTKAAPRRKRSLRCFRLPTRKRPSSSWSPLRLP